MVVFLGFRYDTFFIRILKGLIAHFFFFFGLTAVPNASTSQLMITSIENEDNSPANTFVNASITPGNGFIDPHVLNNDGSSVANDLAGCLNDVFNSNLQDISSSPAVNDRNSPAAVSENGFNVDTPLNLDISSTSHDDGQSPLTPVSSAGDLNSTHASGRSRPCPRPRPRRPHHHRSDVISSDSDGYSSIPDESSSSSKKATQASGTKRPHSSSLSSSSPVPRKRLGSKENPIDLESLASLFEPTVLREYV